MNPLTDSQDLQELENRLLQGARMVKPHATQCLEGTRTAILADIGNKTEDCNVANVIHIYGAPGSGKSSISLTAKSRLHREHRLVTYFRFDRNEAAITTPTALWCRVAYDLAQFFPPLRLHFLRLLRNNEVDLDSPMDIFTSLIQDSLSSTTTPVDCPLVIIIDALDECGGLAGRQSPDRRMLLQTLRRWPKLPKCFKLLVTSRPEGDIFRALSSISAPIEIPSGRSITENPQLEGAINSSNDIRMFLEDRFLEIRERVPSLPADWPGSETMGGMVHCAAGIFMWATTAANFIDDGIDPDGRLHNIMEDASSSIGMKPLYSLYSVVLEMAFGKIGSDGAEAETLQCILGTMILAKRPFVDVEYSKLPTKWITQAMLDSIRDGLRSVIAPGSLRFVHKSFDDFLLSEECPPKYAIRKDQCHYLLARLSLTTMREGLCFNICGLETSCLKNADVPDIQTRVVNGIPPLLSYSCLFFADHLSLTPFDEFLMREVQEILLDKLLFWFEVMSLLNEINRVSPSLLLILKWLHISPIDEFKDFLHDAHRFVGAFGDLIAQSTPHLYISALPFAPENSSVAQHFLPQFPWTLSFFTKKPTNWPSCIFTSEHHRSGVSCVAFSADEKSFVSGSYDGTICILDAETGNLISGPFEFHFCVTSVCFDPNGRRVVAGYDDGKMICWDIETGDKHLVMGTPCFDIPPDDLHCRFVGSQTIISAGRTIALWNAETGRREQECDWEDRPDEPNMSVDIIPEWYMPPSIAPDGCYIAAVTEKFRQTIRIWKVVGRSIIRGPVDSDPQFDHPEKITALSFSVDSKFVVSGLVDGTISIWDVCTGDNVGNSFSTGDGAVCQVAFSPKNHLVASTYNMLMVWDGTTRELLGRLEGHTSRVNDIALSRDGQKVITASIDGTVRMWDLSRKGIVLRTNLNQTHTSKVKAVAFSPCGTKLASLDEYSIQGWDTSIGKSLFKCGTGTEYHKLIFSPDGSQVVTYTGRKGSIGVWSANTGELVSQLNLSDDCEKDTRIGHVAFRSTDGMLVLCSDHGVVRIWSIKNGVPQIIVKLPKIVALSPDGSTAIVCDDQRSNPRHYVWSTTKHQPLPLVFADDEHISGGRRAYSPSGRFFASFSGSYHGEPMLRVWNMRTGGLHAHFSLPGHISSLAFSPDNRHIAISYYTSSNRNSIWVLDARTGQLISGSWTDHTDKISTLAFSPDGKMLASGSQDRQIRIWSFTHMLEDTQLSLCNLGVGTHIEDGWVKDVGGKLLFWVPKDRRARLVWPHSQLLGDAEITTELDPSRFKYGDSWMECFSGGDSSGRVTD